MLIQIILSTTREGRFSEKVASWVVDRLGGRTDFDIECVDLRDHMLPFFDGVSPARFGRDYPNDDVRRFGEAIDRADGYIMLTAEYNHGYPAVLKNAFDNVFPEFNRKPIAFAGYGNSGGARSIEQLRMVVIELEMAPLRHAVHVLPAVMVPAIRAEGEFDVELFASLDEKLATVVDDLLWWTRALGRARAQGAEG